MVARVSPTFTDTKVYYLGAQLRHSFLVVFAKSNEKMTAFFIKTEEKAVGPFSGIELREAAMAGILRPDTRLGGSASGPWVVATDTGLFSEKKMPLPHPPGTPISSFQVRGGIGGMKGPFKLRELIGFATRGLMPAESMIRSDQSPEWISVGRINILSACLDGHLVLIDADGKVVRRATQSAKKQTGLAPASLAATRAPSKRVQDKDLDDAQEDDVFPESTEPENSDGKNVLVATRRTATDDEEEEEEQDISDTKPKWWKRGVSFSGLISVITGGSRWRVIASVCSIALVIGMAAAFSKYRNLGLQQEKVIGDWIANDSSYGVSFKSDGTCVVFDTRSDSWTGDYDWIERIKSDESLGGMEPFTAEVTEPVEDHAVRPIEATDGYMRLRGRSDLPTQIGKVETPDCFLRKFGDQLRIGYLSTVVGNANGKTMYGAWMTLNPSPLIGVDPMVDLASMEMEPPPQAGFSTVKAPHISEVVSELSEAKSAAENLGSLCYSQTVNAKYLLENYGIPDEARALFRFELATMPEGQDYTGSQMVRYGSLKLILAPDGTLQYATIMK